MRLPILLLLALFCYAQLEESGGGKRKMKKLAKQIKNLQEDIECLMDDMKKCKSELKELQAKFAKMLTFLYKKDPKTVCTFFPGESFPAGDGCNMCTCGRDGGLPMCSLRQVPCNSNDGCYDKNGKFFEVGDSYFDGCNTCWCTKDFKWLCTKKYCPPKDVCKQKNDPGPCKASFPMWYYDYPTGKCKQFTYGGCKGNDNRFPSIEACRTACVKKGCYYKGSFYKKGQSFLSADGCNKCYCGNKGMVVCTLKYCLKECPPRSNVIPGFLQKCPKNKPCPRGEMCCPFGCKNYCVEGVDRRMCDKGLPLSGTNGVVYCGQAHDGNNCPEGSTCNDATGVCCQTIECPKKPPASAKKCPKKKPCPKGKMCCTYGCKNLCVEGVGHVEPKFLLGSQAVNAADNEQFCFCQVECPVGFNCTIHPLDPYYECCKLVQQMEAWPILAEPNPSEPVL